MKEEIQDELLDKLEEMEAEVDDTLERLMGDQDLYIDYLVQLPENQNIILLRKAIEEKDYVTAEKEVHTLKGIGLNLGLLPLVDVCMDLLLDLRADKTNQADEQLLAIEDSFQEWTKIIKEYNNK